ncbi:MAG: VWA domain-containing protein [Acidobacteria bacterium]|nr:VWA domain-containing protein [Acidobacteriota bacterium]
MSPKSLVRATGLMVLWGLVTVAGSQSGTGATGDAGQTGQTGQTGQAGQAGQAGQRPVFVSRIDTVTVDVIVTDKQGRPVTDLTAADFEIQENKQLQAIDSFKLVQIDDEQDVDPSKNREIRSLEDQARETAREDVRVIVIFLDDYHTRLANSMAIREKLARFVRGLNSRDLVALMTPLLPTSVITFSRNHNATARQIMAFQGRKFDYTPKFPVEEIYQYMQPPQIEALRNQIVTSALEGLTVFLGTLRDGRKTVLFVSEGLMSSVPEGASTTGMFGQGTGNSSTQQQSTMNQLMQAERAMQSQQMAMLDYLKNIFVAASRSNTAIYTLDPRGLAASEFDVTDRVSFGDDRRALNESMDVLRIIADNTDGRAMVSSNDPLPGLRQMLRDSSSYYLLGYTSSEVKRDGTFHPIKVSVKRRDVEVRARSGYWSYTDEDMARAAAPSFTRPAEVVKAFDAIAEPVSGRLLRSWFAGGRRADGRTDVTVVWEALRRTGPDVPARVMLTASGADGALLHRGRVAKTADASGRVAGQVTFAAPPGPVTVRLAAETDDGDTLDTDTRDWIVPDFTGAESSISTPRVYRARTARDIQTLKSTAAPLPVTERTFARIERLLIRFEVYTPGPATPVLRLLNRNGDAMSDWPVTAREGDGTEDRTAAFEAEVALGGVPPGDYLLEVAASADAAAPTTLVALRVTG